MVKRYVILLFIFMLFHQCGKSDLSILLKKWSDEKSKCNVATNLAKKKLLLDKDSTYIIQSLGKPNWGIKRPPLSIDEPNGEIRYPYGPDSNVIYNYSIWCDDFLGD